MSLFNSFDALFLDSSVIIKWFRKDEELRSHALNLRQKYLDGQLLLFVLDLSLYEIANVLHYKPDLSASEVGQAVQSLWDMGLRVTRVTLTILARAIQLAHTFDLTIYDAAFLAAAQEEKIPLVTADLKLHKQAQPSGQIVFLSDFADSG